MKIYEVEVTGRMLIRVLAQDEWEAERVALEVVDDKTNLFNTRFEAEVLDDVNHHNNHER